MECSGRLLFVLLSLSRFEMIRCLQGCFAPGQSLKPNSSNFSAASASSAASPAPAVMPAQRASCHPAQRASCHPADPAYHLPPAAHPGSRVKSFAVCSELRYAVVALFDSTVTVWDLVASEPVSVLQRWGERNSATGHTSGAESASHRV